MPSVLLAGFFGTGNAGDEAILAAAAARLRVRDRQVGLVATSNDPATTRAEHAVDAVDWRDLDALWDAVTASGCVLVAGGGLLHDTYGYAPATVLTSAHAGIARVATLAAMAHLADRPLVVHGVGVGPLRSETARASVRRILGTARHVTVRDTASAELVEGIGAPRPLVTADTALGLEPPGEEVARRVLSDAGGTLAGRPLVAVSVRQWEAAGSWAAQVAAAVDHLVDTTQARVVFVLLQGRPWRLADDSAAAAQVRSAMRHKEATLTLPQDLPVNDVAAVLAHADLVVGMRLHASLLASLGGTPSVGLAYDPKVSAVLTDLGLGHLVVDVSTLADRKTTALDEALRTAWRDRAHLRRALVDAVEERRTRVLTELDGVVDLIGEQRDVALAPGAELVADAVHRRAAEGVSRAKTAPASTPPGASRRLDELEHRAAVAEWKLQRLRQRRWWRLGQLIGSARAEPRRLARLPLEVLRLARAPGLPSPPSPPRTSGRGGERVTEVREHLDALPRASGPTRAARPEVHVATVVTATLARDLRHEATLQPLEASASDPTAPDADLVLVELPGGARARASLWPFADGGEECLRRLHTACRRAGVPLTVWDTGGPSAEPPPGWLPELADAAVVAYPPRGDVYARDGAGCRVSAEGASVQPRKHSPTVFDGARARHVGALRCRDGLAQWLPAAAKRLDADTLTYRRPAKGEQEVELSSAQRPVAPKLYRVLLQDLPAPSDAHWLDPGLLATLATRTPVVVPEHEGLSALGAGAVLTAGSTAEGVERARTLLASPELADRQAHRAWRQVMDAHTTGARLESLLASSGAAAPTEPPLVSLIVPTNRAANLPAVLATVARQTYPALELVVVAHGISLDHTWFREQAQALGLDRLTVVPMASEHTLGACLNAGLDAAAGQLVSKMDDDNLYAPEFIADLLRTYAQVDAEIVGKRAYYAYLAGPDCLLLRFGGQEHRYVDFVSGSALVIDRSVTQQIRFPDLQRGEDTQFLRSCQEAGVRIYAADRFNYCYLRQAGTAGHTWKISDESLMARGVVQQLGRNDAHIVV